MDTFIFTNDRTLKAATQAQVQPGIKSKRGLFDNLSHELKFPDYFGNNWDALDECITDLSWLPPGDVIISHRDLPLAEDRVSLITYLSILQDAVESWKTSGSNLIFVSPGKREVTGENASLVNRILYIFFPASAEEIVKSMLAEVT